MQDTKDYTRKIWNYGILKDRNLVNGSLRPSGYFFKRSSSISIHNVKVI